MTELFATVDLGGTKIACALATGDGQLVFARTIPTHSHEGAEAVLDRIGGLINELAAEARGKPTALGMGVPGLADLPSGTVRFLPNLPGNWRDVPVRAHLSPMIGCPVYLLNDVRLATLGELVYGHGRQVTAMAFLAIGTGIGGGVAINGKLLLGELGAAGEIGHQTIVPNGPRCGCGNYGCMETLASGPAITAAGVRLLLSGQTTELHRLVKGDPARITPKEMARAAEAGDTAVREVLVQAITYLGIGIANVVSILHPQLVVLGGSVADIGPILFQTLRRVVPERVGMFPADDVRIEPSQLGNQAGLLGGIALARKGGLTPGLR
jgi:glucokinase